VWCKRLHASVGAGGAGRVGDGEVVLPAGDEARPEPVGVVMQHAGGVAPVVGGDALRMVKGWSNAGQMLVKRLAAAQRQ
jgi:hypothetical protein